MQNQNVRLAVSFLIGLVVGIGGYKLWMDGNQVVAPEDNTTIGDEQMTASSTPTTVNENGNSIAVDAQVAGTKVTVSEVTFTAPAWVAIHDDVNGKPGRILGAQLFDKGTSKGEVTLLRSTVSGKNYIAVIHSDNGDHKFTPATDKALEDAKAMVTFSVNGSTTVAPVTSTTTSSVDTTSILPGTTTSKN